MAIGDILKGKSDNEIYQGLVSLEPNDEIFYKTLKFKKLHLLKKLITDSNVDEQKRNIWKQLICDHKKYINDTFEYL